MLSKITISPQNSGVVTIDIEGVIGLPEVEQFNDPEKKVTTYEKFKSKIESIASIKSSEIVVNIRSTGGSVSDALLIYDTLLQLDTKITTRCYGYVASAATIIAQAATIGHREISSNALYLIHNSTSATEGNSNQIGQTIELLNKTDQRIASIYALRSGNDAQMFHDMMNENNGNGKWLSPSEALEAGLVDTIISNHQTKNIQPMEIKNRWQSLLQVLGISFQTQDEIQNSHLEAIENELSLRQETIQQLENKVADLKAQTMKLSAMATATKPKEDPSLKEGRTTQNKEAYNQDIQNFK